MALIHRTKVTHSYEASPQHLQKFFSTLTHMYEEQVHTDVHLVAKDGTLFGVHRVSSINPCQGKPLKFKINLTLNWLWQYYSVNQLDPV